MYKQGNAEFSLDITRNSGFTLGFGVNLGWVLTFSLPDVQLRGKRDNGELETQIQISDVQSPPGYLISCASEVLKSSPKSFGPLKRMWKTSLHSSRMEKISRVRRTLEFGGDEHLMRYVECSPYPYIRRGHPTHLIIPFILNIFSLLSEECPLLVESVVVCSKQE